MTFSFTVTGRFGLRWPACLAIVRGTPHRSQEGNPAGYPYGYWGSPMAVASWNRERIPSL